MRPTTEDQKVRIETFHAPDRVELHDHYASTLGGFVTVRFTVQDYSDDVPAHAWGTIDVDRLAPVLFAGWRACDGPVAP